MMTLDGEGSELVAVPLSNGRAQHTPDVEPLPSPSNCCIACGRDLHGGRRKRCRRCQSIYVRNMNHVYRRR